MSDYATSRQKMVDGQVRPSDVTDLRIIEAMLSVPREEFIPASLRGMAYLDLDLDIGNERFLIKPVVIARLLQAAGLTPTDRVLVVGCATGYITAVASQLARRVTATESDTALAAQASATLAMLGYGNASVVTGPAALGSQAHAPFDVIILAGATQIMPEQLCAQLAPDGRLVGVFATDRVQRATLVVRSHDDFGSRALFDATVPVLPGLERVAAFAF